MQPDQVQRLTQLIKTSNILRTEEREAWLAMLPVMNDKQANDLFGILSVKPVPANLPKQPALHQGGKFKTPPLRHITNLPSDMALQQPSSLIRNTASETRPSPSEHSTPKERASFGTVLKQRVEEKELSAGPNFTEITNGKKQPAKIPVQVRTVRDPELESMKNKIAEPRNEVPVRQRVPLQQKNDFIPLDDLLKDQQQRHLAAEERHKQEDSVTTTVSVNQSREVVKLEDVQHCGPETLRNLGFEMLKEQLVQLVRKVGYFAVVLRLEKSLLYQAYIQSGNAWLLSGGADKTLLSKQEFEQVTDLMRSLQVSQTN
jgi:hypothetical protein